MNELTITEASKLAAKAREGLRMVALGEDKVIEGWLLYGAALNQGRAMFHEDDGTGFGRWLTSAKLAGVHDHDRAAAMWADNYPPQFLAMRRAHPKVRTVRGLHAKWKETQPGAVKVVYEEASLDEIRVVQKLQDLVAHPSTEPLAREQAQRKLDTYTTRFGEVEPETPTQQMTKKELSSAITSAALKKAVKSEKAFEIIAFAIRQTYGTTEGHLERVLAALKSL